jgi:Family of unknown function (DUF7033)
MTLNASPDKASSVPEASVIRWLQQLLHERVSKGISLRVIGSTYQACNPAHGGRVIEMPCWDWGLGRAVEAYCCLDVGAWGVGGTKTLAAPGLDALFEPLVEERQQGYCIRYDIFGLAYWMLSRAEEVNREDLDEHDRFRATSSHAYRHGYLDRPIVDEWFALLRQIAQRLWPGMTLSSLNFRMLVSHDVDRASEYAFCPLPQLLRNIAGDIVKRRKFGAAARRSQAWLSSARLHPADPFNTFDWLMALSERRGLRSAFYFISGRTDPLRDARYELEYPAIRELIRAIYRRGHEIGLHPSYGTYQRASALKSEAQRLFKVCAEEGVTQDAWGGRMHYLRWKTPVTLYGWEGAGMSYDSTLGYADVAGFRCGTCLEYPAFDPVAARALSLRIRPLVAMDCTVMAKAYMGLGTTTAARDVFVTLKNRCRSVGGSFTLLWHNSQLVGRQERELYESVLEA